MRRLALILPLALCACGPVKPDPPVVPKVVHVTVEKILPVPAKLTARCDEVAKKGNSYGEAVRLANARLESIRACNAKLGEIEGLGK